MQSTLQDDVVELSTAAGSTIRTPCAIVAAAIEESPYWSELLKVVLDCKAAIVEKGPMLKRATRDFQQTTAERLPSVDDLVKLKQSCGGLLQLVGFQDGMLDDVQDLMKKAVDMTWQALRSHQQRDTDGAVDRLTHFQRVLDEVSLALPHDSDVNDWVTQAGEKLNEWAAQAMEDDLLKACEVLLVRDTESLDCP